MAMSMKKFKALLEWVENGLKEGTLDTTHKNYEKFIRQIEVAFNWSKGTMYKEDLKFLDEGATEADSELAAFFKRKELTYLFKLENRNTENASYDLNKEHIGILIDIIKELVA